MSRVDPRTETAPLPEIRNGTPDRAEEDDWVELHLTALRAGERAPQVPADTASVPLEMLVKGFLLASASVGETAAIRTASGRRVSGTLASVNPPYVHHFGEPVAELATIGRELRALLALATECDE